MTEFWDFFCYLLRVPEGNKYENREKELRTDLIVTNEHFESFGLKTRYMFNIEDPTNYKLEINNEDSKLFNIDLLGNLLYKLYFTRRSIVKVGGLIRDPDDFDEINWHLQKSKLPYLFYMESGNIYFYKLEKEIILKTE